MDYDSYEDLLREVLEDKDVRTAAVENDLRRELAAKFDKARCREGLSLRELAGRMGTSLSQVQRVLHREVGGSLTLRTVVRAADALKMKLVVRAHPEERGWHVLTTVPGCRDMGKIIRFPLRRTVSETVCDMEWEKATTVTMVASGQAVPESIPQETGGLAS